MTQPRLVSVRVQRPELGLTLSLLILSDKRTDHNEKPVSRARALSFPLSRYTLMCVSFVRLHPA